jgi:hypothetical protein
VTYTSKEVRSWFFNHGMRMDQYFKMRAFPRIGAKARKYDERIIPLLVLLWELKKEKIPFTSKFEPKTTLSELFKGVELYSLADWLSLADYTEIPSGTRCGLLTLEAFKKGHPASIVESLSPGMEPKRPLPVLI